LNAAEANRIFAPVILIYANLRESSGFPVGQSFRKANAARRRYLAKNQK